MSFGRWPGVWPIQTPGLVWSFTCFVILTDIPYQLRKAFSPCSLPPLSFGDDQMGKQARKGLGKCKVPYKSTKPIVSEHLLCTEGSDQEFTVLEKC